MLLSYLKMAIGDIVHRKKRSFLTVVGIFIGIVAIVALITVGQGVQNSLNSQFQSIGSNVIMITPGAGGTFSSFGPGSAGKLSQHDIDLIEKVRGVDLAGGIIAKYAKVEYESEVQYTFVIGLPTDNAQAIIFQMQQVVFESGQQKFSPSDKDKVVVGYAMAHGGFFKKDVTLKSNLLINNRPFKVVSIIEKLGNPSDDQQIYIPIDTAKELFNSSDDYYAIIASIKPGFTPSEVADSITKKMRDDRGLKVGEENFNVQTPEQLVSTVNSVLGILQVVLIGIAGISLLVGGIGIMNTMYTSVMERTNEIGVMKAIGAKNSDILLIFLFEAGILGLVGGIVGCAIGISIAEAVQFFANAGGYGFLKVAIDPVLIGGTLMFSFLFGIITGLLPAIGALKLKIVDALHYE